MTQNQLGSTDNFAKKITAADGTDIIEVLNCANYFGEYVQQLLSTYHVGKNFYLEQFSGAIYLPSLAEAPMPEIFPEMNAAERIAAAIKIEKDYPFIGIRFYCKKGAGSWQELATSKAQNKGTEITYPWTTPYLTINEIKVLGASDRLGISIINYGDGVLGPGDYINVKGDFRYHLDLVEKPTRVLGAGVPYGIDIPGTATQFRAANTNRAILYATNTGDFPVWVAGNNSVAIGNGIFLAPRGNGSLTEHTLTGEFWAITEGGTSRICGLEASYG
jgi:hypothetical protein